MALLSCTACSMSSFYNPLLFNSKLIGIRAEELNFFLSKFVNETEIGSGDV